MPTLAELRAQSGPQPLPRTTKVVTLVEGQHLLAESEALSDELLELAHEEVRLKARATRTNADGEKNAPPRKSGEGSEIPVRLEAIAVRGEEIKARQSDIVDELAGVQGEIGLHGVTGGDWQRFKDQHPPRHEVASTSEDGTEAYRPNASDQRLTAGNCDSAALFAALGKFVATWDGETVTADDWDKWLAERICYADRRDLIPAVVQMHEAGLARSPKFRSASPTTSPSVTG